MDEQPATEGHGLGTAPRATPAQGLKWALQTLALPLALVALPLLYQWKASEIAERARAETRQRELADQQFRLYTDLMSRREDADTQVRRGLFDKLIGSYLNPAPDNADKRLVALELLSLNFHDALNLSPLFWDLARDIEKAAPGAVRDRQLHQLDRVAKQVKDRQTAMLEGESHKFDVDLPLLEGDRHLDFAFDVRLLHDDGTSDPVARRPFTLTVTRHDARNRSLAIVVSTPGLDELQEFRFALDPFDFPLVNFSRVSRGERFAVMLYDYDARPEVLSAKLVFLYFPSWRGGAKDKPYLDDLMARLAHVGSGSGPASAASAAASK
jgi:hypothetical protein